MRKILPIALVLASMGAFVQNALAADIPARMGRVAPLTAPVYGFTWTGCYIGANVGYGVSPKDWDLVGTNIGVGSHDTTGIVGGGQVGCDFQTGAFVFGVEGMFDWSGMDGSHTRAGVNFDTEISWVAAITGRIGWAAFDRGLVYVKGGAAWVDDDYSFGVPGLRLAANGVSNTGWTVGAGVEWSFAPAWSAKLEYNFMDFGGDSPRFCVAGACGRVFNIEQNIHLVTVGLNYRFSWH
jgi:outer membrane immunogenic protein